MRSTVIYLYRPTRSKNDIGEWVSSIERIEVFAQIQSVSSSEWFNASQIGLAPEIRFIVFSGDYQGETVIEHEGQTYAVYRVYHNGDFVELYCQREAGNTMTETTTSTEVIQSES